jgi:adenosylcobyric acid synthase
MAKTIMLQGTSSHVGKSILTTALCRIFLQDGKKVVPFKAQNMALNSYVTKDGKEMGRAQVAQAEAAGLDPQVEMNPVLLKPTGNSSSQVIVMGQSIGNMSAAEYHSGYSLKALGVIKECLDKLNDNYDVIVIEGAGSPAEVNLKANDIVNMRIAKMLQAPVFLIADIDRGGALASIVGTLELLDQEERDLIKGLIINKFRGDISLLQPALDFLVEKTGKPVIGVVPYLTEMGIDDEDSVSLDEKPPQANKELDIAVLQLPKISNFTDFDALAAEEDVTLRYIRQGEQLGHPDLIILPGSKNTTEDLRYLTEHGYAAEISQLANSGVPVVGICGGYQMLGEMLYDPQHTESGLDSIAGLGLLPIHTTFVPLKVTHQIKAKAIGCGFLGIAAGGEILSGYEIHMGRTTFLTEVQPAFTIVERSEQPVCLLDGVVRGDGHVMGTYLHGLFDNDYFRRQVLDALRVSKGLFPLGKIIHRSEVKEAAYNRLAQTVRTSLDMSLIKQIMER